jgi:uncharacterized membrane protein YcaP (DUF421 family)
MSAWLSSLHDLIGRSGEPLQLGQMLTRGLVVFVTGLVLIRLAAPRIFSRATPIDIVLAVIIGSNFSRTLTGNAPFFETMIVTALLVALHALLAHLAARFTPLATLLKGSPRILAQNSKIDWAAMRTCAVGRRDLLAAVRRAGGHELDDIDTAVLERDGEIEVVLAQKASSSRQRDSDSRTNREASSG